MDSKKLKELGAKIKSAREKQKLTQVDVSEKTNMTTTYYSMIERGEVNLTYEKLQKIFKLLKMKASEIPL